MALRTPAHNFSMAQKRVGITSKRRQFSCRTCQTVYCRATAPSSNLGVAISFPLFKSVITSFITLYAMGPWEPQLRKNNRLAEPGPQRSDRGPACRLRAPN